MAGFTSNTSAVVGSDKPRTSIVLLKANTLQKSNPMLRTKKLSLKVDFSVTFEVEIKNIRRQPFKKAIYNRTTVLLMRFSVQMSWQSNRHWRAESKGERKKPLGLHSGGEKLCRVPLSPAVCQISHPPSACRAESQPKNTVSCRSTHHIFILAPLNPISNAVCIHGRKIMVSGF